MAKQTKPNFDSPSDTQGKEVKTLNTITAPNGEVVYTKPKF